MHIPSNDEIRKAVIKKQMSVETSEDIVLLELGKAVLNTPEGWPEKNKKNFGDMTREEINPDYLWGREKGIDECNLARLKEKQVEVPTIEEIEKAIKYHTKVCKYGYWTSNSLAKAVQELIKSKQEKKQ